MGLIQRYGVNGRRGVKLSRLGIKMLNILYLDDGEKHLDIDTDTIRKELEELENILKDILARINGFHAYSSITSLSILYSIFKHRQMRGLRLDETKIILSKGHAAPALYAVFKFFGILDDDDFIDAFTPGSHIQSHPVKGCPMVLVSTGSLGQGLSIANGIAISHKMRGDPDDVYVVMGDGELDEGQVWEALSTASTHNLDNIILLIDRNGHQLTGPTEEIKIKEPLIEKLESFGWMVERVSGENPEDIINALNSLGELSGWPKAVIVDTHAHM